MVTPRRKDTRLFLGHKLHVGVDGGKARIVTAVVATPGNVRESQVARSLVERHEAAVGSKPEEAVADKGYGSIRLYRYLRNKRIKPSIARARPWRKRRDEKLKAGFHYDAANDVYVCPQGKKLYKQTAKTAESTYKVHQTACKRCALNQQVCKAKRPTLTHSADQTLPSWVESHLHTYGARKSLRDRRIWPEMVIAEIKNARGLRQARLRGVSKVWIEGLLASAAHDVLQIVKNRARAGAVAVRIASSEVGLLRFIGPSILET